MPAAIQIDNLSKLYRLGEVGTGTVSNDITRWWYKVRGKEDPFTKIGQINDRTQKDSSNFVWSLKDINLSVEQGDIVGVIGRNGAGKSTLLKILSGITAPTTGQIKLKGRMASLLEVGTGFHPEMTGLENIYMNGTIMGMTRHEIKAKLEEIVEFAGVSKYLDTPVKRYSSGMMVRLGFAVAAHLEPEILIVDEVLAVGDAEFQKKALGKMQEVSSGGGKTVLFVSHNMSSVLSICKNGIVLENGQVAFKGEVSEAVARYFSTNSLNNIEFENEIVKKVSIDDSDGKLILSVDVDSEVVLDKPQLGFVISDKNGVPIFGSNQVKSGLTIPKLDLKKGTIQIDISQPKLYRGTYTLSLWLGDLNTNYFSKQHFMSFNIDSMAVCTEKNYALEGPIIPACEWTYNVL